MEDKMKYYRAVLGGKPRKDSSGVVLKDANGKPIIDFIFTSNAPKGFTDTRIMSGGKFIILYLTEDEATTTKSKNGEEMMIPSPQRKAKEVTVFQNQYPVLFPFLEQAINDTKYHELMSEDRMRLTKLLVPGLVDTFDVGFEYYQMTRDAETGKMVPFLIKEKRDPLTGKIIKDQKVRTTLLTQFWYGNEVERADSLRKAAIKTLEEYAEKVKPEGVASNRDEVIASMAEESEGDVTPPIEAAPAAQAQPAAQATPVVG